LGLLLIGLIGVSKPVQAEDEVLTLHFHHALFEYNDRSAEYNPYPATLYLAVSDTGIERAVLSAPYLVLREVFRSHEGRDTDWSVPDVSQLSIVNGQITGTVSGLIAHRRPDAPIDISFDVNATIVDGEISGSYTGTLGAFELGSSSRGSDVATPISGPLSGDIQAVPSTLSERKMALYFMYDNGAASVFHLNGSFDQGMLAGLDRIGLFRPHASLAQNGLILNTISEMGYDLYYLSKEVEDEEILYEINSASGTLTDDTMNLSFSVTSPESLNLVGTWTVQDAIVIGDHVFGHLENGNNEIKPFRGRLPEARPAPNWQPGFSELTALNPAEANIDTFAGPYFETVPEENLLERLETALNWMRTSEALGPFHSDDSILSLEMTGSKQYDNGPLNAYGAMGAMSLLAERTNDPEIRRQAEKMALRGGFFGIMNGDNRSDTFIQCYKTMGWWNLWMGQGFLDLYESTGDPMWLDRAVILGRAFQDLQLENGSWTYVSTGSGYSDGESCSRNDRSSDGMSLASSEHLLFFGRLRALGVTEFIETEDRAFEWKKNQDSQAVFWNDLADQNRCFRENEFMPMLYAKYLIKYRDTHDYTISHLQEVISFIEEAHADWSPRDMTQLDGFTPSLGTRTQRGGPGRAEVMASGTMASVYADVFAKTGEPLAREKAEALLYAALSAQNMANGELHHSGVKDPALIPTDIADRSTGLRHRYTAYQAYAFRALDDAIQILSENEDDGLPAISLTALEPRGRLAEGTPAVLQFRRLGGGLSQSLTVDILVGGTAVSGVDYQALPDMVTFPAGQEFVTLEVTPLGSTQVEGEATVAVEIAADTHYKISAWKDATVALELLEAPTILSGGPSRDTFYVGESFSYDLEIIGSPFPSVSVSGLPTWLSFDGDKTLSGTPTPADAGSTVDLIVTAENASGEDSLNLSFAIAFEEAEMVILNPSNEAVHYADELLTLQGEMNLTYGVLHLEETEWTSDIDGVLGAGLTIDVSALSTGFHQISLTGTNGQSVTSSTSVILEVRPPLGKPRILEHPQSDRVFATLDAAFSGSAEGLGTLAYQWLKDGEPVENSDRISGAQTPNLELTQLIEADDGFYSLQVTNNQGTTSSNPARLEVLDLPSVYLYLDFGNNLDDPSPNWNTLAGETISTNFLNWFSGTVTCSVAIEKIAVTGDGLRLSGAENTWGSRQVAPEWADPQVLADRMWVDAGDQARLRIYNLTPGAQYDIEIASSFDASGTAGSSAGEFRVEGVNGLVEGFNAHTGLSLGTNVRWVSRGPNDGGDEESQEGWLYWPEVEADTNGEIQIHLEAFGGLSRISVNAMRLLELTENDLIEPSQIAIWRDLYFGSMENEGDAADSANPSGDGLANLLKYAVGLNPLVAATGEEREIISLQTEGSNWSVDLRIPEVLDRPDIHYIVEYSEDLETWLPVAEAIGETTFQPVAGTYATGTERVGDVVRIPLSADITENGFFRLRIGWVN
jgi:hypothetical protein